MTSDTVPYSAYAARAIRGSAAERLLISSPREVVVLERLARSAGSTNWYVIQDREQLDDLATKVSPGSTISFYFDGRVARRRNDELSTREIIQIATRHRDAVVGRMGPDGMTLVVDFVSNEEELDDFTKGLKDGGDLFFGAFPGRDNDGTNAVTFDLPDADGIVRAHPH